MKHHVAVDNLLHSTLPAVFNDGKRASVTVSPQSLFLNDNHHLWSKKRIKAYEKHMKKKPNIAFDENTVNCKIHQEVQNLRSFIPENERIGELGIHSIADYIDDDSEPFWSYEQIQLGRYGPFRWDCFVLNLSFEPILMHSFHFQSFIDRRISSPSCI